MHDLLLCPVCGKYPTFKYERNPTGTFVTIKCKPLFRKAHLKVTRGKADDVRAMTDAIVSWNHHVIGYMLSGVRAKGAENND